MHPLIEVGTVFLRLGLTSFGGPVAHLGYFRHEFVQRRRWLSEEQYAELIALSQFLPGPASSQVGMALGLQRAGIAGLVLAWLAFTLPSAFLLIGFAAGLSAFGDTLGQGWLRGMKAAAVAVVAHALVGMGRSLVRGRICIAIAMAGLVVAVSIPGSWGQVLVIALGGVTGWLLLDSPAFAATPTTPTPRRSLSQPLISLLLFAALLLGLPALSAATDAGGIALFERFYRAGALVFGGGHVVLPLLQAEVVDSGWVGRDTFLAGYGAAQAIPGPLFSFAAYLGMVNEQVPAGLVGAAIALVAIFLPAALLIIGVLPFWERLRHWRQLRQALRGVNAAVVGLLAAALWNPVLPAGLEGPAALLIALTAWALLAVARAPAWAVVAAAAGAGALVL